MDFSEKIFRYCERGSDPSFWAEPLNALSNAAFLIAALTALLGWLRLAPEHRKPTELGLIALLAAIGIGSFLFHTFATRWAGFADTAPIGLFMLCYLAYALRRHLRLGWSVVAVCLAAFIWSLQAAGSVSCSVGLISVVEAARGPCLNGTAGYVPAFLALMLVAAALTLARHPAARLLALASGVFLASMFLRTVDWEICDWTVLAGHRTGTHFLWHVLNAALLYVLLLAALRHGSIPDE